MKAKTIKDYINENFNGNQSEFARQQGIKKQMVTRWIKDGFVVIDGVLYSPRRELNDVTKTNDNQND